MQGSKWTAKPGKLDELTAIYAEVTKAMEQNEPGAEAVHCYASEQENALYVRDEFKDASALGFHLQTTAAGHFPSLLSIAVPGPFFFFGDVPEPLKQATEQKKISMKPLVLFVGRLVPVKVLVETANGGLLDSVEGNLVRDLARPWLRLSHRTGPLSRSALGNRTGTLRGPGPRQTGPQLKSTLCGLEQRRAVQCRGLLSSFNS